MFKIPQRVELLFAKAVALHQAGRLKSTVYLDSEVLYLLNGDHTILIRHDIPAGEVELDAPLVFNADDYEGAMIENVDDEIAFTKKTLFKAETQFTRVNAAVPEISMSQVDAMFENFSIPKLHVNFDHEWMKPIRDDLSHIEFVAKEGHLHVLQRDIYAGRVYDTWREANTAAFGSATALPDFGPIAVRTADFKALMDFSTAPILLINPKDNTYFMVRDAKTKMLAVISCCLYDELGYIHDRRKTNGREITQSGNRGSVHQDAGGKGESGESNGFKRRA